MNRRNSSETFTKHSVNLVKTWIDKYINTHPSYRKTDSNDQRVLPGRLFEINEGFETPIVRLVKTKNISNNYKYLILSYY